MPDTNNTAIPQIHSPLQNRGLRVVTDPDDDGTESPPSPGRLIPVTYSSMRRGQPSSHRALIPWTTNYDRALESAIEAFRRYFPSGSTNRFRWLSARVQVASGSVWADVTPQVFPVTVADDDVELRLNEEDDSELDVSILPIGHSLDAAKSQTYYEVGVITVGEMSVGKTMMYQYFTKKECMRQETLPQTNEVTPDFTNRLMTAQGELIKATLWDTAGQERFRAITRSYYNKAQGAFLLYNIADLDSFNRCADWLAEIRAHVDERTPIMLIGNQIDRESERAVSTSQGQNLAFQHNLLFIEVSAKCGTNVDYAFRRIVHEILSGLKARNELDCIRRTKNAPSVDINQAPPRPWWKCC
ncbi:hypothetical protein FRC08_008028 [Ceratobasidium sp. 394]|nr:hypothetical protein FRC08_008028 [Ceratobasidium sp. 394]